jgi:Flp pilus assembly protein TadG
MIIPGGNQRGQALVEFSLTLPLLLLMAIGAVEMGQAFNAYTTVTGATRDAARSGSLLNTADICALVNNEMDRLKGAKQITITRAVMSPANNSTIDTYSVTANSAICSCVSHSTATVSQDRYLEVELRYTHSLLLGFQIPLLPTSFELTSMSRFPVAPFYTAFGLTSAC